MKVDTHHNLPADCHLQKNFRLVYAHKADMTTLPWFKVSQHGHTFLNVLHLLRWSNVHAGLTSPPYIQEKDHPRGENRNLQMGQRYALPLRDQIGDMAAGTCSIRANS